MRIARSLHQSDCLRPMSSIFSYASSRPKACPYLFDAHLTYPSISEASAQRIVQLSRALSRHEHRIFPLSFTEQFHQTLPPSRQAARRSMEVVLTWGATTYSLGMKLQIFPTNHVLLQRYSSFFLNLLEVPQSRAQSPPHSQAPERIHSTFPGVCHGQE
jgi:hypothetical protein